ncbi:MAG: DUF1588 domain-containing protein [Planctomycetales bacterium]|nr:DUF1588 domain-containing protein [Planctomycetales bacterium]
MFNSPAATRMARCRCWLAALWLLSATGLVRAADEVDTVETVQTVQSVETVRKLLAAKCVRCHGEDEANAELNLEPLSTAAALLAQPKAIQRVLKAVEANNMPPEDEPQLAPEERRQLLTNLRQLLRQSTAGQHGGGTPLRRLNRFQYNYTVKDLFQLSRDPFALPEKLMTRHDNYLARPTERLPNELRVASLSLRPEPGLEGVSPFPVDLRAEHGFDNQASQLTLSPLLLDAFLRLSVSIVESPGFNEQTVGIWPTFFAAPPADADLPLELRRRLRPFLTRSFRRPVDDETLERYATYGQARLNDGMAFADTMKKLASATLSSPRFLCRTRAEGEQERQFELAESLSYFLWSSCPDAALLELAERGELAKPEVRRQAVDRMLADPKIERFLDSFPAQWMQLGNLLAATPDPKLDRLFRLDSSYPASLQMLPEPLLLFDALFVEDRPIAELIAPEFSYRSEFLKRWYAADMKPPQVDVAAIAAANRDNDQRRAALNARMNELRTNLAALTDPVRAKLLAARRGDEAGMTPGTSGTPDLRPYAVWDFDGDLREPLHGLDLTAHGEVKFENGAVVLEQSFLQSKPLPMELKAKTMEVRFRIANLDQRGGGLMTLQGPGNFFDAIVIGERQPRHWISGSNNFQRTEDFPESTPETVTDQPLHLAMVYAEDGTTTLYRNGEPYGKPFQKGAASFPKEASSVLFGLRHLPAGGNRHLSATIDQARLYDRALTIEEVQAAARGLDYVSPQQLADAMSDEQRAAWEQLTKSLREAEEELGKVPANRDPQQVAEQATRQFDESVRRQLRDVHFRRVPAADPRYGGVVTNAAMLSMTSGPNRTHPVARGVWIVEVIFNDPPPPPPNDVPPLNEDAGDKDQTIREKFAAHRENPSCAGCHAKLDPLGFALENFDLTGRWRDRYANGREVDASGKLLRSHEFANITQFKSALVQEQARFAKAFTGHLLRYAMSREPEPIDTLTVDEIVRATEPAGHRLKSLVREVALRVE